MKTLRDELEQSLLSVRDSLDKMQKHFLQTEHKRTLAEKGETTIDEDGKIQGNTYDVRLCIIFSSSLYNNMYILVRENPENTDRVLCAPPPIPCIPGAAFILHSA